MHNGYRRQEDFFQMMQDLQDEADQHDRIVRDRRLRTLAAGLKRSFESLELFESQGIDVARMPQEILSVWKQFIPEVWSDPHAGPLINLLFPNS
jgi:hypothetical protein